MSLFSAPLLKRQAVTFAGSEFELFELSAFDRCEYLEKTTGHIAVPKNGEITQPEMETLGQLWALRREDVSGKLLLVAYALKPGREESLDALHRELCFNVAPEQIDGLYVPAAKLSGLYVEPDVSDDGDEHEDAEKKG
ncbi:hypothetical protein [Microbulbifer sp. HZ11]|uniref:hypothetical protein n=1 Tax=Microbulbifer sp. HZ11 TaxID=1453501 RepID=UPI0005BAA01B|nr:hypothetical protein [Microbulbifer sp. HZ11]